MHVLQYRSQTLQAHAGVDAGFWQWVHDAGFIAVKLHEDVIPNLDVTVAVFIWAARWATKMVIAVIVENLRARAARAGVAHHPEVV